MNERQDERPDDIDLVTEERLRRAVRFRDAEVATSADAIGHIRRRASEQPASPGWLRPGTIVGAAAAAAMVVAGLAFAFGGGNGAPDVATGTSGNDTEPETDDSAEDSVTPPSSSPLPPTTSTVPPTTSTPTLPDLTPQQRAELGLVVWPLDSRSFQDPTTVVFSYATQALGIDDPHFEIETEGDDVAFVTIAQRGEDGAAFGEATRLDLVALDDFNWVVVRADSPELEIRSVRFGDEGLATVSGAGRSFEGTARIVSRSICDPVGVITPVMVGGGPEFGEFVRTVAFVPCPDSPLVIELATEEVLEDGVPFVSAVAYLEPAITAPGSNVVWSVMRVEPDDVLNVRAGPGIDNEIVATLASDTTGIEIVSRFSESVNGQLWREIITPDGQSGWVNIAFLTAQADLTEAKAGALTLAVVDFLSGDAVDTTAVGPRGVYVGGIGVFADAPTPFVHVDPDTMFIDDPIDWNPFPDDGECGADCVLSVREFLGVAEIADRVQLPIAVGLSKGLSFEDQFLYGPIDQLELFDALYSVTLEIPASNDGDLDWRVYHLWFDWADGSPQVIAIWLWGWTP